MSKSPKARGRKRRAAGKSKSRRVLLQPGAGFDDFGSGRSSAGRARSERLMADGYNLPTHPIVRLTKDGIDWGAWPGPGDLVGYGMHPYRQDDCLQAAIATCTQVPIEQVPDLALDRRFAQGEDRGEISRTSWERIDRWARRLDLELRFSETVPLPCDRWIGVVGGYQWPEVTANLPSEIFKRIRERDGTMPFQDHCLVMSRDRLLFDPSCSVRMPGGAPPGTRRMTYRPHNITYGISFDKEE